MRQVLCLLTILLLPLPALTWGFKGHQMINRAALDAGGGKLPELLTSGRNEVIYNGYEPDRWREERDSALNIAQAPDHFLDSEYYGSVLNIPADRYKFVDEVVAARKAQPVQVGYLPYSIIENYGRLKVAFRSWRNARTAEERVAARAAAIHYAGVMGHYVADGSQPMHMTVHYNGWADNIPNPKGYTKDRGLHSRYESAFIDRAIEYELFAIKVQAPERLTDVFGAVKRYLNQGFLELEPMFEMERTGEFNPESPRQKGRDFIIAQLARASSMLGNLWYTAWIESGEPMSQRSR